MGFLHRRRLAYPFPGVPVIHLVTLRNRRTFKGVDFAGIVSYPIAYRPAPHDILEVF